MSEEVAPTKDFRERMLDRIRDDIGDLITDDELKTMIEAGIKKAMFETRYVDEGGYSSRKKEVPSLVDAAVQQFLKERMDAAVRQWLEMHPEELQAAVDKAIANGVAGALTAALDDRFKAIFQDGMTQMYNNGWLRDPNS